MSESKHTPGPWAWFGNTGNQDITLAATHSGRRFVMDFRRWGLQRAQPRFQIKGLMEDASDLVKFEVGDGKATGKSDGKSDGSVYRLDVAGIDHPDARLIAAAPEMLEILEEVIHLISGIPEYKEEWNQGMEVISKVKGDLQ